MATIPEHDIAVIVEGKRLRAPNTYSVDVDMLQPADSFSASFPLDRQTWDFCPLDGEVRVTIDDVPCFNGFVETVQENGDGSFTVQARDRSGRLVDESIPGANYRIEGELLSEVLLYLVSPWYTAVSFSNATDRRLRRGSGKQVTSGREPALTFQQSRAIGKVIDAGTSRWEAVERVLSRLGLIAWGSADGATFVVAQPNYSQAIQYEFFETPDRAQSNVISMRVGKSNANRYAQIVVSGSGRGLFVPLPPFVPTFQGEQRPKTVNSNRLGIALDTDESEDGTGGDFLYPKRLFVVSEAQSQQEAAVEATRAMARAQVNARSVELTVPGHGQLLEGARDVTLYAPDTMARVFKAVERAPNDDAAETLFDEDMYITRVNYHGTATECHSTLGLVPKDSLLL